MIHPIAERRPTVDTLLQLPQIKKILRRRRLMKPFNEIVSVAHIFILFILPFQTTCRHHLTSLLQKKCSRNVFSLWHTIKIYIVNIFVTLFSIFKLRHLKKPNQPHNIALTSTPTAPTIAVHQTSTTDDSFLRLDDSEIDFEDSPSNRSLNRSHGKPPESLIVNSTPLNHYNSHGSFRRSRMEISRTSLV